jgi:membrane-associated phospholipid phosphatase
VRAASSGPGASLSGPGGGLAGVREGLFGLIGSFDDGVDSALERLRGHPVADQVFHLASDLADWSVVWHLVGAAWGLTSARRTDRALRLSVLLGAESLIVNQGIKRLFLRRRPTESGDARFPVRTPSTSSFPSGHASAAFFAASVLTDGDPLLAPLWFGLAAVVGTSRAYVRIHHASDVVAGAAMGLALAAVAKRIWPAEFAGRRTE